MSCALFFVICSPVYGQGLDLHASRVSDVGCDPFCKPSIRRASPDVEDLAQLCVTVWLRADDEQPIKQVNRDAVWAPAGKYNRHLHKRAARGREFFWKQPHSVWPATASWATSALRLMSASVLCSRKTRCSCSHRHGRQMCSEASEACTWMSIVPRAKFTAALQRTAHL